MSTSIFQGDRILGNRRLIGGTGIIAGSTDPLASIPSLLDLRTHRGDKVPTGINPTANGTNPLWQGTTGSATQPLANAQPLTKFASDGTPYLDFDGVDDWMSVGVHGGKATYTILVRSKSPAWSIWAAFLESTGPVDNPDKWGSLVADSNQFQSGNLPEGVRCGGIDLSSPFPIQIPNQWNVITVATAVSPGAVTRGLLQWESRFFLFAEIIGLFLHNGDPSPEQIEVVEQHFMALRPTSLP